jgi:acetylornithine deacetylase/succinyl-diaminopimelate desuccinylase-like protein
MFGGAAPDAVTALVRLLATLHDDDGNVAVQGLDEGVAAELDYDEARFRAESGLLDGVDLIGSGSILSRLWTKPSLTTIGIDATSMAKASNTLSARAAAKVSMRIAPSQDPQKAFELLRAHLEQHAPWGAQVSVELTEVGAGFAAQATDPSTTRPARRSATPGTSTQSTWGRRVDPVHLGLRGALPEAAILVTGVEDPDTRAHGANESLHLGSSPGCARRRRFSWRASVPWTPEESQILCPGWTSRPNVYDSINCPGAVPCRRCASPSCDDAWDSGGPG